MKQNCTTPNAKYTTAPSEDSWGFYGVVQHNEHMNEVEAAQAFADAFEIFRSAPWQPTDIAIRNFLRSRWGRHFADSTSFYDGSLKSRIQQASGEKWVAQEFANLARQGFDTELFEDDDIA